MRKTKYTVKFTTAFKKDYKKAIKRGMKIELLEQIIELLSTGKSLPPKNRDHDLTGNWAGYRECHILPDWLLIYRIEDNILVLTVPMVIFLILVIEQLQTLCSHSSAIAHKYVFMIPIHRHWSKMYHRVLCTTTGIHHHTSH